MLLFLAGGPGQPGSAAAAANLVHPRRRAVRVPDRRARPAWDRSGSARLQGAAEGDGQLRSVSTECDLRPCRAPRSSAICGSSSAATTSWPTSRTCATRSASTAGRSTPSRTAPMWPSDTHSSIRSASRSWCWTPSFRTWARPTSASTSSRRPPASSGRCAALHCVSDLATVVKTRHVGPRLLDALTLMSIVDPTYTSAVDIPSVLRDARRGDLLPLTQDARARTNVERRPVVLARPGAACQRPLQRLAVSVGLVDRSARRPQGRGRPRGRADPGEEPVPVRPGDRGGQRLHQAVPALVADAGDAARNREDLVPTLILSGDHDLSTPLEWAQTGAEALRTADSSSSRALGTRRSRARSATSAGRPSRTSCSARHRQDRGMSRVVVVSTHLDDAVFSCWSVIADPRLDVSVVTVFSAARPGCRAPGMRCSTPRSTRWCAPRSGARRTRAALARAGRTPTAPAVLRRPVRADGPGPHRRGSGTDRRRSELVYAPLAIANDEHVVIREAVRRVCPRPVFYVDYPYALRSRGRAAGRTRRAARRLRVGRRSNSAQRRREGEGRRSSRVLGRAPPARAGLRCLHDRGEARPGDVLHAVVRRLTRTDAEGGNRTHTPRREPDFESGASASSATSAGSGHRRPR